MRNAALAKIQIARKDLELDDDTYRDMLHRATKLRSCAGMTEAQKKLVLIELKRLGWTPTQRGSNYRKPSTNPHIRKVWALAKELDRLKWWDLNWKKGLVAFVKKETGVDDPDWMTTPQASRVIEALKSIRSRQKAKG